jgi:hypothetical protein
MAIDVVAQVRDLITLAAANPAVNEARAAAVKACQLIKQHGLEIIDASAKAAAEGAARAVEEELRRKTSRRSRRKPTTVREAVTHAAGDIAHATVTEGVRNFLRRF